MGGVWYAGAKTRREAELLREPDPEEARSEERAPARVEPEITAEEHRRREAELALGLDP